MDGMNKWKMNRAGLLNFWYYDEEVFDFSDGKLLLRGSNGSGKSVTMQSFLPVLLDGKKSPDRLDPFGSKARRMEDYLLGEKEVVNREERTGYLFLEYKKENSSQYITTGIGLQAKRHKDMKFWGFVITDNRRIGEGFQLYQNHHSEKIPLSAKELENRIGDGGQVVRSQREYMNLVNKYIFGFQTVEAYDELIKLLIQLRSPKLSKDFRPTVIYEILESALPPLGDDDLRHLSDTIENMDQARQQLEQLEREHRAAKKLVDVYDQYNRYILAEKADYLLKTETSYQTTAKKKDETEELIQKLSKEIAQLQSDQEDLKRRKEVAEGERERLSKHEVWGLQKELARLEGAIAGLQRDFQKKHNQLDAKKSQELTQRAKLDEISLAIFQLDKEEAEILDDMELDAREAAFSQHPVNVEDLHRHGGKPFDFTVWEKEASAHANLLDEIKSDFLYQERYKVEMESKYREASELRQQIDSLRNEQADLEKLFENDKQQLEDLVYQWIDQHPELEITGQAKQDLSRNIHFLYDDASYDDVKAPVIDAIHAYQQKLVQEIARINHSLDLKDQEKGGYEEERNRWKNMNDPEPDRAEATSVFRAQLTEKGKAFVPFYAAVDFQDHVPDDQKERIEAAIKQSGILDSIIIEDPGEVQDDRYIRPNPSMFGHTLADYLKPDLENGHPVSKQLIDNVLRTILIGDEPSIDTAGTISIDENGFYRIGDLFGHAPKEGTPRFIGRSSRKRFQKEKIAEFEAKIEAVTKEINELQKQADELGSLYEDAKQLKDTFPVDQDLREIYHQLQKYRNDIEARQNSFARVDAQYKEAARQYQELKQKIQDKSKQVELKLDLESYTDALHFMKSYLSYLNELKIMNIRMANYRKDQQLVEQRIAELEGEILEAAGERNELEGNIKKAKADMEAVQNQLKLQGIDEIQQRIQQVQRDLTEIDLSLDLVKGRLPARQENIKQHKAELEVLKRETSFWAGLYESWKHALDSELSRKFLAVDDPSPDAIFSQFQSDLKKYDRAKMNEQLTKAYYNEQPNLMEYRLTEYDQPFELPESLNYDDLNANEQLQVQQWLQVNRRKIVLMEYQGQKVSPYYVFDSLEQELETQQQWLDEQDRQLYEDIILKSVGAILRSRIQRAEKWIKQMDRLMESRNSSSGLTFSIAWKPKTAETEEELDTKELVELLQMNSKFLKEEDLNKITRHFQSKISKAKELIELRNEGNTLHQVLKEVLDYRKWFSFILSYRREGEPKRELTNNAFYKFSGGEKAMAMYIPLFTAAYSRYQEAAPTAPYIISLDEAFAGVDENNIRDMFQVVEELGFNYIMNSQALWGDYDTVSGLSICELVRPKNADFVTVIRYRWDGQTKHLEVGEPVLQE
ncbi:TIGR02680 family protein [Bacillus sp. V3-13]|uniref:TIGR02680 family protein n=1 Tax=Bacillus sp. V3-13 TaxID=2053728 RepID=UPI0015E0C852|nr:TIGR02680 family protein [Bacillus sp. V3-13]